MRATRLASVTLLVAAVAACDRLAEKTPTSPGIGKSAPDILLSADEAAILAEAGVPLLQPGDGEQGATGGVWYLTGGSRENPSDPVRARLAFSAIKHRDGTFSGQYDYKTEDGKTHLHGSVTCLLVGLNTAQFSGPTSGGARPVEQSFSVVDNGEGGSAPPDLVTGPVAGICGTATVGVPGGVYRGDLQVHS